MKAVYLSKFGGIEVLQLVERQVPTPGAHQVRVRVRAASLNPIDSKIRSGSLTLLSGRRFPMPMGADFAGVVDAVGPGVTSVAPGDEVFGACDNIPGSAYAEYVVTGERAVYAKPANLSFEEAAAVPIAGIAALMGLRDLGAVQPGMTVLINGCTGGVGCFALQVARALGAAVVGACSAAGSKLAQQLGAQEVIDYRSERVTDRGPRFDLIFELSGRLSFQDAKRAMTPRGVYIDPAPTPSVIVGAALMNPFRAQKRKPLLGKVSGPDLQWLATELRTGRLRSQVGRVYPFAALHEATKQMETGGVLGKIVLQVAAQ